MREVGAIQRQRWIEFDLIFGNVGIFICARDEQSPRWNRGGAVQFNVVTIQLKKKKKEPEQKHIATSLTYILTVLEPFSVGGKVMEKRKKNLNEFQCVLTNSMCQINFVLFFSGGDDAV